MFDYPSTAEMIKKIPQWEKEFKEISPFKLSKRQIELLDGAEIKSNEGMLYGQMYSTWKSIQLEQ